MIGELSFHIWNANSQSFARTKSEAKMAAHTENFGRQFQSFSRTCTLVPVLYTTLIFRFCSKTFPAMETVLRQNITGPVLHIREFKKIHYCRVA